MPTEKQSAKYNLLMLSGDSTIACGVDSAFYRMLEHFSQYWQRIDILTPTAPNAKSRVLYENVFVHPAPNHRLMQPLFIKRKGQALMTERDYHLVVSHDFGFFYNGIGAQWLLHNKKIPLVSEIHHIEGYPIATTMREQLWRKAAQRYLPFIAKQGAYFRVVNDIVAQQLIDLTVSSDKILKLYSLYLDLEQYQIRDIPKQYDVLFIARLTANKGVMNLLEAIHIAKQSHPDIVLAIRGDGVLKSQMQTYIQSNQLTENVIFLPRVANTDDMPKLYQASRMLICASTIEGNPRVTIEAMACGIPVISTHVGIMPEVIQNGENGLLVDSNPQAMAEAICDLLEKPDLYQRLSKNGRAAVTKFEADQTIKAYTIGYHDIIESNN